MIHGLPLISNTTPLEPLDSVPSIYIRGGGGGGGWDHFIVLGQDHKNPDGKKRAKTTWWYKSCSSSRGCLHGAQYCCRV